MEGVGTAVNTNLRIGGRYFQMIVVFGRGRPNRADYARKFRTLGDRGAAQAFNSAGRLTKWLVHVHN